MSSCIQPFLSDENFIIKDFLSHEIFVLFSTSPTSSRHLQSKDEICVEFIKQYIMDYKSSNLFFNKNISIRNREISAAWHAIRRCFVVCWHGSEISLFLNVSCIIYHELAHLMKCTLHPTQSVTPLAPRTSSI